jgi:hypothetical protein
MRLLRYIWTKMRDNWRHFRQADPEEKWRLSNFLGGGPPMPPC